MDPWKTKEWDLGTQQQLPEVARLNCLLYLLSIALVAASIIGGVVSLIALALADGLYSLALFKALVVVGIGLVYARFCYRRSLDLEASLVPFALVRVGREQSRAVRSVSDEWHLVLGVGLALALIGWPALLLMRVLGVLQ